MPSTFTCPSRINFSASRLEQTPALLINLANLCTLLFFYAEFSLAHDFAATQQII